MAGNIEPWGDRVARITVEVGELVLGIDPVAEHVPHCFAPTPGHAGWLDGYVDTLLSAAAGHTGIVKFQSGCFEAFGSTGVAALARALGRARTRYAVILDGKRGDVPTTAAAYARAYLTPPGRGGTDLEADCLTVNPFLGPDTLEPFVECARVYGKGVLVQVKNSNPGSGWIQDQRADDGQLICERVARFVQEGAWNTRGDSGLGCVGAVVGVTYPQAGAQLRQIMADAVLLAPGAGPQGGRAEDVRVLRRPGGLGALVPVSRSACDVAPGQRGLSRDEYHELVRGRLAETKAALSR